MLIPIHPDDEKYGWYSMDEAGGIIMNAVQQRWGGQVSLFRRIPPRVATYWIEAELGTDEGETCYRNDCCGEMQLENPLDDGTGSCSCHISAPCYYCEGVVPVCSECQWYQPRGF